jgi:hypothetical protein
MRRYDSTFPTPCGGQGRASYMPFAGQVYSVSGLAATTSMCYAANPCQDQNQHSDWRIINDHSDLNDSRLSFASSHTRVRRSRIPQLLAPWFAADWRAGRTGSENEPVPNGPSPSTRPSSRPTFRLETESCRYADSLLSAALMRTIWVHEFPLCGNAIGCSNWLGLDNMARYGERQGTFWVAPVNHPFTHCVKCRDRLCTLIECCRATVAHSIVGTEAGSWSIVFGNRRDFPAIPRSTRCMCYLSLAGNRFDTNTASIPEGHFGETHATHHG